MTPAQKSALEGLVNRPLTEAEEGYIDSFLPARDDVSIAGVLSVGRTALRENKIGIGTILAVMRPNGGAFLSGLKELAETDPNVFWTLELIKMGGLDVGMKETREELLKFAAARPDMAPAIEALLATAEVKDPIHYNAVSDALNVAEGRLRL